MAALAARARWIPHNEMVCDGLTKSVAKDHLQPLLKPMATGSWANCAEQAVLEGRKATREDGGRVPRYKKQAHD
eukprot:NODE_20754_length_783_cov_4.917683.p4 GENE.NODE_20754_length_783_cov_4.917683~~NODE_20754_length_783_cov_4.917683.p4  ORF type:complete len:74 (-),score=1.30 NODE_20754_length_783_cov_4.917683:130-351(-)